MLLLLLSSDAQKSICLSGLELFLFHQKMPGIRVGSVRQPDGAAVCLYLCLRAKPSRFSLKHAI